MLQNLPKKTGSNLIWWILIVLLISLLYGHLSNENNETEVIAFSDFLNQLDASNIESVVIRGNTIEGLNKNNQRFSTLFTGLYPELIEKIHAHNVKMQLAPTEGPIKSLFSTLLVWFPGLLFIGVWVYFMRNMQGGGAMGFGKSKARLIADNKKVTFADVAGIDEAKEELSELVEFLRNPMKYNEIGAKVPRGCLLIGDPGTGKTLLAKAIAGEAGVPFFTISGSDFVEMFVGVGASRVRDMFIQAKKQAPCILFIDEIDAVGRHRGAGRGNANDEREQTLNQILVEMDGFSDNEGVIVIAATNRADVLDNALLRPGRFDRRINVLMPDINGRKQILTVHTKNTPLHKNVDLEVIARGTPGFSGADLANLVNEAGLLAAKHNRKTVNMHALEVAKDKVMMGPERKSAIITDDDKKLTAYHEGGHALVCLYVEASDPIHKVTIIPRGHALGMVMRLPENDKKSVTLQKLRADIAVAMGGRAAEEIIFGKDFITTGASSDIEMATRIARNMVTVWGLSDKIGPVNVLNTNSYGYDNISNSMGDQIDSEIKKILE